MNFCKCVAGALTVLLTTAFVAPLCAQHPGRNYRLKKIIPVEGRQGVAVDSGYYYVSDTKVLYKYDKKGRIVARNDHPFMHPERANHFGDIDVYDGEIYCGIERFEYGRGYNIAISVYDASTLQWKRDFPWAPESGQVEVSGLAVDRDNGLVWMSDWVDSRYVYAYDLATGRYHSKMQCRSAPYWCQGIFVADGMMLFTADDGEAQYGIPDNIYVADVSDVPYTGLVDGEEVVKDTPFSVKLDKDGKPVMRSGKIAAGAKAGRVRLFREMNDFLRAGEIEGLSIDPVNDDLVVLNNRGTRIVLGMSQGPISDEGYTGEVHELYIYEKID
jgi:outer membrane protein assembly factor BamB